MKKCSACGCIHPDTAHYCGRCGKNLETFGQWKLYNTFSLTTISHADLARYKRYEADAKASPFTRFRKLCKEQKDNFVNWWKKEEISDVLWGIFAIVFIGGLLFWLGSWIFDSCVREKTIERIEVNGKYGIGTDKDNLIIPAEYDSISKDHIGDQWILYDKKNHLRGLAYATKEEHAVIPPKYNSVWSRNEKGTAILRLDGSDASSISYFVIHNGVWVNQNRYGWIKEIGNPTDNLCMIARLPNSEGMHLLDASGNVVDNITYLNIQEDKDSTIKATKFLGDPKNRRAGSTVFYDYKGNKIK